MYQKYNQNILNQKKIKRYFFTFRGHLFDGLNLDIYVIEVKGTDQFFLIN